MFSLLCYPLWAFAAFLAIILINVLYQKLPRKPDEPPLVFHWLPFFGNAVAYGLDPCGFFEKCREQVRNLLVAFAELLSNLFLAWRCFHLCPLWPEDSRLSWYRRQRLRPQQPSPRCQRRRNLRSIDDPRFR